MLSGRWVREERWGRLALLGRWVHEEHLGLWGREVPAVLWVLVVPWGPCSRSCHCGYHVSGSQ